jgi:CheY-like chemotaxis protein
MRQLRSQAAHVRLPAIALTAYARAEDAAQALRAGYQEHMTKPVDAGALLATVERIVQR